MTHPSALDLSEDRLHRLLVWASPRVHTKRDALRALTGAPDAFRASSSLARLVSEFEAAGRVTIDRNESTRDRFIHLIVARQWYEEEVARIARICQESRLVLFDPEGERLLVPSAGTRLSQTRSPQSHVATVRESIGGYQLTGDSERDARNMTASLLDATSGILADDLLPKPSRVPFDVPASLRFAIPVEVPPGRQRKAALTRLLDELADDNPNVRRAAAFDLGGWSASDKIDTRLVTRLNEERDTYVRSVLVLSLALRAGDRLDDLIGFASAIIAEARDRPDESLVALGGSFALLAAAIVTTRSPTRRCRDVAVMGETLASIPSESVRAKALLAAISEHCE